MAKNTKEIKSEPIAPAVDFTAAGDTPEAKQANVITARQSPAYYLVAELIADAIIKRVESVMLDYTREGVAVRFQIDGVWHQLPPRDRESGDAMLAVLKRIANLNINERRARQSGEFKVEFKKIKCTCTLSTQGVKTGERVLLAIARKGEDLEKLEALGMRPGMQEKLNQYLEKPAGLILLSAPTGGGLRTTWTATLNSADRFMRDFISIEDENNLCPEVINVGARTYNATAGESPEALLPKIMLKQPDVLVVPDLVNAEFLEMLCDLVTQDEKLVIARIRAKSAAEALVRTLKMKASAKKFAKAISMVVNQRLVRRLCEPCRQAYKPPPNLLQRLGIPPGRIQNLYREFQPPPPEQLVDEKGKPIPPPFCGACQALGYKGRLAVFEMLEVDDHLRQALVKNPQVDVLQKLARKSGFRTLQEEGVLQVASGVTSLAELQRILKQ